MADITRVAVVGAGGWGIQHVRAFTEHPGSTVVGVYSRRLQRARQRAADWHTSGFDDLDQLVEEAKPDLISVCLPSTEHFATTMKLLGYGIPLLVEKPLVFDLDEGVALVAEARHRGTFFAINFNHRYAHTVLLARADLQGGRFGPLSFLTWRFGGEGSSAHDPNANLIETQCHGIDMLEYLGGPIASVAAQFSDSFQPGNSTLAVALRFANGAVGSLLGSYDSSYVYPGTQLIEINGLTGRALIEDTVKRYTFSQHGNPRREVWEAGYFDDTGRSFARTFDVHLDALLSALRAGEGPPVPAEAGLRALEVSNAIIRSHATGTKTDIPPPSARS